MKQVYRVSFFKKLVGSDGHPVEACQGVVEIQGENRERAIANARMRFAELTGVSDWSLRADYAIIKALPGRKRASASARTKSLEEHAVGH